MEKLIGTRRQHPGELGSSCHQRASSSSYRYEVRTLSSEFQLPRRPPQLPTQRLSHDHSHSHFDDGVLRLDKSRHQSVDSIPQPRSPAPLRTPALTSWSAWFGVADWVVEIRRSASIRMPR